MAAPRPPRPAPHMMMLNDLPILVAKNESGNLGQIPAVVEFKIFEVGNIRWRNRLSGL